MPLASPQKSLLSVTTCQWITRVQEALLRMENCRRRETNRPLYPKDVFVCVPFGPNAALLLLTLKVWTIRYCVTLDFLLDVLTLRFKNKRRYDPNNDRTLTLGLPAPLLVGTDARQCVEEAIVKAFPNGENYKMARQPYVPIPLYSLDDEPEVALQEYKRVIRAARGELEKQYEQRDAEYERKFRR
jgi:hypothetical protein